MSAPAQTAPRHRRARRLATGATVVVTAALAAVVVPTALGRDSAQAASLTAFAGCDQLAGWFAETARPFIGAYGLQGWPMGVPGPVATDVDSGAAESAAPSAPTGTNVQEVGVDEPDLVKTDGTRVVTVRADRLSVVDVSGPTPRRLGSLRLGAGQAAELLLVGDRALVLGSSWGGYDGLDAAGPDATGRDAAVLTVVDLSDPTRPRAIRTETIDGRYLSAREHDGAVRVVLTSSPHLPFVFPDDGRSEREAARHNRALVDLVPGQAWLPQRVVTDAAGAVVDSGPLLACTQVSHPDAQAGVGVLTVLTLDLGDPAAPLSEPVAVAADGDMVYASADRLYVATTRGGWQFPQPVDTFQRWLPGPDRTPTTTQLHGFDITDRNVTTYAASGSVDGWLLGRWALSAQDGYLRVATTRDGAPDAAGTDSAVTVLAEDGQELSVVGSVGGLGRGEQIRGVRWFGDLATVVTFRQTDPLYTVDLSDPTTPRILGELKVTGYSAYLHPLGDGLLLGVGQDGTEDGRLTGAKIATFDLRDLSAPTALDSVVQPRSWADVEGDSRAFTYLPDRRLAVTSIGTENGSVLWAVAIGADGSVRTAGQWTVPGEAWLARAIPVGGNRMAVVTEGSTGNSLTVLTLAGLSPIGSVSLN